jgi:hypothetical protein
LQVGDTGPVESARRSNSRVLGSPFSGLSGHIVYRYYLIIRTIHIYPYIPTSNFKYTHGIRNSLFTTIQYLTINNIAILAKLFPSGIEPETFCVLGRCDNRYTTET